MSWVYYRRESITNNLVEESQCDLSHPGSDMLSPVFQNHHHPPTLGCLLVTSTSHWVSVSFRPWGRYVQPGCPFIPAPSLRAEGLGRGGAVEAGLAASEMG